MPRPCIINNLLSESKSGFSSGRFFYPPFVRQRVKKRRLATATAAAALWEMTSTEDNWPQMDTSITCQHPGDKPALPTSRPDNVKREPFIPK
jgi:hypothetical protein